jgi:hypothetical protein
MGGGPVSDQMQLGWDEIDRPDYCGCEPPWQTREGPLKDGSHYSGCFADEIAEDMAGLRASVDRTQTEWFKWLTVPGRTFATNGEIYAVVPDAELADLRGAETVVESARNLLRHGPIDGPGRWLAQLEAAVRTLDDKESS